MKTTNVHIELPTLEEIRLYQNGGLSRKRSEELKQLVEENEFVADALEGFSAVPAFSSVPSPDKLFGPSGGNTWGQFAGLGTGIVIGIAYAVFVFSESKSREQSLKLIDTAETLMERESGHSAGMPDADNKVEYAGGKVSELKLQNTNAAGKMTGDATINAESGERKRTVVSREEPREGLKRDSVLSYIPIKDYRMNDVPQSISDEGLKGHSRVIHEDILHIRNYHIVNYTTTRKTDWSSMDDYGVPAIFESRSEKEKSGMEKTTRSISYLEYIEQGIDAFSNRKYQAAIENFNVVLANYPDDINALFYGAMSYYYDGELQKAVNQFDKAARSSFHTFDDEIAFYHAKSLNAIGRYEEAEAEFRLIEAEGGFYSGQAGIEITLIKR